MILTIVFRYLNYVYFLSVSCLGLIKILLMLAHSTKDIAKELTKLKKEKFDDELGFMHDIKNEVTYFIKDLSPSIM